MDDMEAQAARTQAFADTLVGMPEADAVAAMEAASPPYAYRVVERDGESFPVTMDYSPTRINLSITAGVVTKAVAG